MLCPACGKHIKVGNGGIKNFQKQHNPGISRACQTNLEKKKKAAHQKSQPGLLSFFTKESRSFVPPNIPKPVPVITYAIKSSSQLPGAHAMMLDITPIIGSPAYNTHAMNVLAKLEKAIKDLPVLPNATGSNEIAMFSENILTDLAKENAWENLDLMLNCFLGFNRSAKSIYNEL